MVVVRWIEWAVFAALGVAGAGLSTAVQAADVTVRCAGVGVGLYFAVLCALLTVAALRTPGYFRFTAYQLWVSMSRPAPIAQRRDYR